MKQVNVFLCSLFRLVFFLFGVLQLSLGASVHSLLSQGSSTLDATVLRQNWIWFLLFRRGRWDWVHSIFVLFEFHLFIYVCNFSNFEPFVFFFWDLSFCFKCQWRNVSSIDNFIVYCTLPRVISSVLIYDWVYITLGFFKSIMTVIACPFGVWNL